MENLGIGAFIGAFGAFVLKLLFGTRKIDHDMIDRLQKRIDALEAKEDNCAKENAALREAIGGLRAENAGLREEIRMLREAIEQLKGDCGDES